MRLRRLLAAVTTLGLAVGGAGSAAYGVTAHEGGTEHGETETFADIVPCRDDLGYYRITITYNAQEHGTETANGAHFTFTQTGTFVATATDVLLDSNGDPVLNDEGEATPTTPRQGESFTGHFTIWGGGNFGAHGSESTFVFRVKATGSEGTVVRDHELFHITSGPGDPEDPATLVKVAFERSNCH